MSTDYLVNVDILSNVIAVVIGIGIAAEALVEAFFDVCEFIYLLTSGGTAATFEGQPYVKFKKVISLILSLGVGIGIGSYVVNDSAQGYALGGLGGLVAPFTHVLVQAGFQGKELLKKKVKHASLQLPAQAVQSNHAHSGDFVPIAKQPNQTRHM